MELENYLSDILGVEVDLVMKDALKSRLKDRIEWGGLCLRDFQVYVEDIVDAIDSIEEYTEELTFERFVKDKKTVDAVVRNLENLGKIGKLQD